MKFRNQSANSRNIRLCKIFIKHMDLFESFQEYFEHWKYNFINLIPLCNVAILKILFWKMAIEIKELRFEETLFCNNCVHPHKYVHFNNSTTIFLILIFHFQDIAKDSWCQSIQTTKCPYLLDTWDHSPQQIWCHRQTCNIPHS